MRSFAAIVGQARGAKQGCHEPNSSDVRRFVICPGSAAPHSSTPNRAINGTDPRGPHRSQASRTIGNGQSCRVGDEYLVMVRPG